MRESNFKYCALHYLHLWLTQDKGPWAALAGHDRRKKLFQLRRAAVAYGIARNLPEKFDRGKRLSLVLEVIEGHSRQDFSGSKLVSSIERVSEEISDRYSEKRGKKKSLPSLTTKFLWLKFRSPIIIMYSRARRALRVPNIDLKEYYSRWREEFAKHERQIQNACAYLPGLCEYGAFLDPPARGYVADISAKRWFRERVFDVYLWHQGDRNAGARTNVGTKSKSRPARSPR